MEINYYLLQKMGWTNDHFDRDLMYLWLSQLPKDVTENSRMLSFFRHENALYSIIGYYDKEKKQPKTVKYNQYQFFKIDIGYKKNHRNFFILQKENVYSFHQLLCLIKQNLACNLTYKRLFQINSIIK